MTALRKIIAASILLVMTTPGIAGQKTRHRKTGPQKPVAQKPATDKPALDTRAPAVSLLSGPSPPYLSGEASVSVRGNENPIIRLGLAQGGVTLIEFPAADRFFALHPGDSDMVTIDDSPTKWRDTFFVFRAGAGFLPPPPAITSRGPSASIIAQMQSGLVVTFLIYPVRELTEMAHRVVVMYSRDDVVAARKLAGLAVNLDQRDKAQPLTASLRNPETPEPDKTVKDSPRDNSPTKPINYSFESMPAGKVRELEDEVHEALKSGIKSTSKIKNWTSPVHGLSLAHISTRDFKSDYRLAVVAVRNTLKEQLHIIQGQPEISIVTRGDKGRALQAEHVTKLIVESSGTGDPFPGGSIFYYAILFPRPILGAHQSLRIAVAHSNAADEPVATDLR